MIQSGRTVVPHSFSMVNEYALDLENEYASLLNILDSEITEGEIIGIKKYINSNVNGSFTRTINQFLFDYDNKSKKEN